MFKFLALKTIFLLLASVLSLTPLPLVSFSPTPTPTPAPTRETNAEPTQTITDRFQNLSNRLGALQVEARFVRTLKRGARGDDVKELQHDLRALEPSFTGDNVTGYFGLFTEKTIKKLQTNNNISATGIFDTATRKLISELMASKSFDPDKDKDLSDLGRFLASATYETTASESSGVLMPSVSPTSSKSVQDFDSVCTNMGYISPDDCPTPSPIVCPSLTPTPSPTPVKTPTPTPTPTPTKTPTPSPTPIPTKK